ncbi:MAG: hypothetical protein HQL26_10825 [Candidatus Omnitrophica bacterium]|nr:hypothetical protein [Candidatus Omnitrophota bacterium]
MRKNLFKIIHYVMLFVITLTFSLPPQLAQAQVVAPSVIGAMSYNPVIIKGVNLDPQNPLKFDFIIDRGSGSTTPLVGPQGVLTTTGETGNSFAVESQKLIRYFLASLTIPQKDMWVNLSPNEPDRIVPKTFGNTEMGRDLLAQDFMLKQLTASLMSPDGEVGRKFWDKIYSSLSRDPRLRGDLLDIPTDIFNKVWIVPSKAKIYEHTKGAFITETEFKVMTEMDYNAAIKQTVIPAKAGPRLKHSGVTTQNFKADNRGDLMSPVVKEIIIPAIEQEVNHGKTFANLRQIYNSLILAMWYKEKVKKSVLGQAYNNKEKTSGLEVASSEKQKIYEQYLEAFRKGATNAIKEEYDPATQQIVAKKYFSGGIRGDKAQISFATRSDVDEAMKTAGETVDYAMQIEPVGVQAVDSAMKTTVLEVAAKNPLSAKPEYAAQILGQGGKSTISLLPGKYFIQAGHREPLWFEIKKIFYILGHFKVWIPQGYDNADVMGEKLLKDMRFPSFVKNPLAYVVNKRENVEMQWIEGNGVSSSAVAVRRDIYNGGKLLNEEAVECSIISPEIRIPLASLKGREIHFDLGKISLGKHGELNVAEKASEQFGRTIWDPKTGNISSGGQNYVSVQIEDDELVITALARTPILFYMLEPQVDLNKGGAVPVIYSPEIYSDEEIAIAIRKWAKETYLLGGAQDRTLKCLGIITDFRYGSASRIAALETIQMDDYSKSDFAARQLRWLKIQIAINSAWQDDDIKVKIAAKAAANRFRNFIHANEWGLYSRTLQETLHNIYQGNDEGQGKIKNLRITKNGYDQTSIDRKILFMDISQKKIALEIPSEEGKLFLTIEGGIITYWQGADIVEKPRNTFEFKLGKLRSNGIMNDSVKIKLSPNRDTADVEVGYYGGMDPRTSISFDVTDYEKSPALDQFKRDIAIGKIQWDKVIQIDIIYNQKLEGKVLTFVRKSSPFFPETPDAFLGMVENGQRNIQTIKISQGIFKGATTKHSYPIDAAMISAKHLSPQYWMGKYQSFKAGWIAAKIQTLYGIDVSPVEGLDDGWTNIMYLKKVILRNGHDIVASYRGGFLGKEKGERSLFLVPNAMVFKNAKISDIDLLHLSKPDDYPGIEEFVRQIVENSQRDIVNARSEWGLDAKLALVEKNRNTYAIILVKTDTEYRIHVIPAPRKSVINKIRTIKDLWDMLVETEQKGPGTNQGVIFLNKNIWDFQKSNFWDYVTSEQIQDTIQFNNPQEFAWLKSTISQMLKPDSARTVATGDNTQAMARKIIDSNTANESNEKVKDGGIDLNAARLNVDQAGRGFEYHVDPFMLQRFIDAPGVLPVILNIKPIVNLSLFLGL